MTEPLLSLRHLVTAFETDEGYLRAVDDVSFDVTRWRRLSSGSVMRRYLSTGRPMLGLS